MSIVRYVNVVVNKGINVFSFLLMSLQQQQGDVTFMWKYKLYNALELAQEWNDQYEMDKVNHAFMEKISEMIVA